MGKQRFCDDIPHCHTCIQGSIGILKDHLHIFPERLQFLLLQFCNILSFQKDPSVGHVIHPDDRPGTGGFSTAGLSYQSQGLAFRNGEADSVHCMNDLLSG